MSTIPLPARERCVVLSYSQTRDAFDFLGHLHLDDVRQVLVEPGLEQRAQQLLGQIFQGAADRRQGDRGGEIAEGAGGGGGTGGADEGLVVGRRRHGDRRGLGRRRRGFR